MSAQLAAGVAALGALGALTRFLVHELVSARVGWSSRGARWPSTSAARSPSASLVGAAASADTTRLLGTGFLGGYTTFSTWMLDTRHLAGRGKTAPAALNIAGSLVAGVLLAWLGRSLG